jgi:hypothetical protein
MSTTDHETLRESIRRTLAHTAGCASDASVIAEGTLGIWRQVAARLAPVIGARGVDVLFSRALHVTSRALPWLALPGEGGDSAAVLASLKARLAGREAAEAAESGSALLVTFTELLATLIGEPLTERLLGTVWVPPSRESALERAS